MSSSVVVTLDTTAPTLTYGNATAAEAGFTFQVAYALSDGSVVGATFANAWRSLAMTDLGGSLTVDLPSDWYEGAATISATVVDDVGNAQVYAMQVAATGINPPAPAPLPNYPSGLVPAPPPRRRESHPQEHRRQTQRSRGRARSAAVVTRQRASRSGHTVTTRYRAQASASHAHAISARTRSRLTGQRSSVASVSHRARATISRRDDPGTEEALFMLGVL